MTISASAWVATTTVTGNDRALLAAICDHASGDYGTCFASQKRLAWDCGGISREVIGRALKRLEEGNENGPYVQRIGVHESGTLLLRPCFERPDDRSSNPPRRCDDSSQALFIVKPDGQAVLGGCDESSHVTIRHTNREIDQKQQQGSNGERDQETNHSSNARARKNLTELELRQEFDQQFWPAYPRKVSKAAARRAYFAARRTSVSIELILEGLGRSTAYWVRTGKMKNGKATQYVPHAATWLNGECWADDLDLAADAPGMESVAGTTDATRKRMAEWAPGGGS